MWRLLDITHTYTHAQIGKCSSGGEVSIASCSQIKIINTCACMYVAALKWLSKSSLCVRQATIAAGLIKYLAFSLAAAMLRQRLQCTNNNSYNSYALQQLFRGVLYSILCSILLCAAKIFVVALSCSCHQPK